MPLHGDSIDPTQQPEEIRQLTTFEQAKLCPKCGMAGQERGQVPAPRTLPWGTKILKVYCATTLCPWFNTPWFVQVNPDGTTPPPTNHTGKPKEYIGFEGHDELAMNLITDLKVAEQLKQNGKLDPSTDRDPLNPFNRK